QPMRWRDQPRVYYQTRGGTPRETLIRLFLAGVAVDVKTARRALQPVPLKEWTAVGLLRLNGTEVRGTVGLVPYQGLLLAHDTSWSSCGLSNCVLGLSNSSVLLAQLTVRPPSRRTLDLGAGGGIQAFLAAAHSDQVVGV